MYDPFKISKTLWKSKILFQFSAAAHPLGIAYCTGLLAAKLVKQGEEVVRAQPKDAFTVAAVVVSLW